MTNLYVLTEVFTNGFYYDLLDIISIVSILCGVSVIVAKNPVVSVLFLIGLFFSIASYLMMLGLNFIGLSYLLVYVGAVSILFLFILMLINVRISELVTDNNNSLILGFIVCIVLFIPLYTRGNLVNSRNEVSNFDSPSFGLIKMGGGLEHNELKNSMEKLIDNFGEKDEILFTTSKTWDGAMGELSHITSIGNVIYTSYPIWLILTSIILLLAMVGAIIITIKQ
jgi:NADH-ubiquinone oxidoreductase chain 6